MAGRRGAVSRAWPFSGEDSPNTPEGEILLFGLLAGGLRHGGPRRRRAVTVLVATLLCVTAIVLVAIISG